MTSDEARVIDTREWLRRAHDDLRGAAAVLGADPPLLGDAAFHAQQASEKAMKAFLTWHDVPFRKTHDLDEVGELCTSVDASLAAACEAVARLTTYAWAFRYPGEPSEPDPHEVDEALGAARALYEAVVERVVAKA
jgi:HEPN domain-containing protein